MASATATRAGRVRIFLRVAAPLVMILVFLGVTQKLTSDNDAILDARDTWEDHGPTAYEMTYTYRGLGTATVVWDGEVVVDYSTDDPRLEDSTIYWVDELFHTVLLTVESFDGVVLSVEFHPTLGYPVRGTLDPDQNARGDEWSFEVLELRSLDG